MNNTTSNIYLKYWIEDGYQVQTSKNDFYMNSLIANIICIISIIIILYYFYRVYRRNNKNKKFVVNIL